MMRRFAAIVSVAGLGLAMAGCGGGLILPQADGVSSGLILADAANETHYNLSVTGGALMLTEIGSGGMVAADPELIDSMNGAQYSMTVTGGSLTLVVGENTPQGALQIELTDTVTAKNYTLAVVRGALTLIPS